MLENILSAINLHLIIFIRYKNRTLRFYFKYCKKYDFYDFLPKNYNIEFMNIIKARNPTRCLYMCRYVVNLKIIKFCLNKIAQQYVVSERSENFNFIQQIRNLHVLKNLLCWNCPIVKAAQLDMPITRYFKYKYIFFDIEKPIRRASANNNIKHLKNLFTSENLQDYYYLKLAVENGNITIVKYLDVFKFKIAQKNLKYAYDSGNFEMFKFLLIINYDKIDVFFMINCFSKFLKFLLSLGFILQQKDKINDEKIVKFLCCINNKELTPSKKSCNLL